MIQIEYVEDNAVHDRHFVFDQPNGHDAWLIVLTKTPAEFLINHKKSIVTEHSVVVYRPGDRIWYRAIEGYYANDWIRFWTDESYIVQSPIETGKPYVVKDYDYIHTLYQLLVVEHVLKNSYKEASIDNLMRLLFNKLLESNRVQSLHPYYNELNRLKMDIYRNPELNWTIKGMAEGLNISVGYFETMYKDFFGISCMNEVISCRIQLAKKYLLYNQYTVVEIAQLCGYNNVEHFFRQFKRKTGMTPNQYRRTRDSIEPNPMIEE